MVKNREINGTEEIGLETPTPDRFSTSNNVFSQQSGFWGPGKFICIQ